MYATKPAYELYVYYLALKKHFTTDFDFFKYNGKVKASLSAFDKRKDKYQFYKLSNQRTGKQKVFANVLYDHDIWIGSIANDTRCQKIYEHWQKIQDSISYTFESDMRKLENGFDAALIVKNARHPELIRLYMTDNIELETIVILDDLLDLFTYWQKKIPDPVVLPKLNTLVKKYRPFIEYDKQKMKHIIKSTFKQ